MGSAALVRELRDQGIQDEVVLAAMAHVPRAEFVPEEWRSAAWDNRPLPIGYGQTISQPFIVAYMAQEVRLRAGDQVLDVGTGCGYQAAILAECGVAVVSVEIRPQLAEGATSTLRRLGYNNVRVLVGDGREGAPLHSPFDAVLVAAASPSIPAALLDQLRPPAAARPGGRLIIPLELDRSGWDPRQQLVLIEKTATGNTRHDLIGVRFVPLL